MKLDKTVINKALGIASIIFAGATAVIGAISDQKKEAEFEELKKTVSELKKNSGNP